MESDFTNKMNRYSVISPLGPTKTKQSKFYDLKFECYNAENQSEWKMQFNLLCK